MPQRPFPLDEFTYDCDRERLSAVRAGTPAARATAVLLHGAGTGSKERLLPLLAAFADQDCHALSFDFSGHGRSTGELSELSLRRRFEQAVAVIDAHAGDGPLILVGFSMSGQTVADLVRHYGRRVASVGLGAPGVFAAAAWDEPFGDGTGPFTKILRTQHSWRDSSALSTFRAFEGRAVLAVPGTDTVIPTEVTEAIEEALCARAQYTRFELLNAEHKLGLWFRDHPEDGRSLVTELLKGLDDGGWSATRRWLAEVLPERRTVHISRRLTGGWSSQMRELPLDDGTGLVLRTFVKPFFRRHAARMLAREAAVLTLLAERQDVPAPRLLAVDAEAADCDHPSLLMTRLPGSVRVDGQELARRLDLLAAQLVRIHEVAPRAEDRPRTYEAWTSAERARTPEGPVWERAVELIRRDPPPYEGRFLHRDYHPGNVLYADGGDTLRISGVVDWVETSWGPADLDVAHCSTAVALLHGPEEGLTFRDRYEREGGHGLMPDPDHLYWRLLDALTYAPDAAKLALPWSELGRTDLTPEVLGARLETYVRGLLERYGD
ncbi:alpha/beta fold hydrolase [Streptomyces sp. NPDC048410]|uniref:alpha/beta fold hydrolase n=1 Tax=Streptomyces sp. NPDC048410 TaxID=3365545 RepID=UPI0037208269